MILVMQTSYLTTRCPTSFTLSSSPAPKTFGTRKKLPSNKHAPIINALKFFSGGLNYQTSSPEIVSVHSVTVEGMRMMKIIKGFLPSRIATQLFERIQSLNYHPLNKAYRTPVASSLVQLLGVFKRLPPFLCAFLEIPPSIVAAPSLFAGEAWRFRLRLLMVPDDVVGISGCLEFAVCDVR